MAILKSTREDGTKGRDVGGLEEGDLEETTLGVACSLLIRMASAPFCITHRGNEGEAIKKAQVLLGTKVSCELVEYRPFGPFLA